MRQRHKTLQHKLLIHDESHANRPRKKHVTAAAYIPVKNLGSGRGNGPRGGLLGVADDDVVRAVHLGRVVLAVADVNRFGGRHQLAPSTGLRRAQDTERGAEGRDSLAAKDDEESQDTRKVP